MQSDALATIYCDTSALARVDRGTGIERVVRALLAQLMDSPPRHCRVVPTLIKDGGIAPNPALVGADTRLLEDGDHTGDHFLMLDWAPDQVASLDGWLARFKDGGGTVTAVVYDLLPIEHPEFFPDWLRHTVSDWLDLLMRRADVVACISRAVATSFADATERRLGSRDTPMDLAWFHLGADIGASVPSTGRPDDAEAILDSLRARPFLLAVGTVEPRKGHRQLLEAMRLLWADGVDAGLLVVGREGWMVEQLAAMLRDNAGREPGRLVWLRGASDEFLDELYAGVAGLVAPSLGEGFGLPLIEAATHGVPILARDIPVFREVAGRSASYFEGTSPDALAAAIRTFLDDHRHGTLPESSSMPRLDWATSAEQLVDILFGRRRFMCAAGLHLPREGVPPYIRRHVIGKLRDRPDDVVLYPAAPPV